MKENEPKFNQSPEEESEDDFSLESHMYTQEEIEKRTETLREKIEDSPDLKFTEEFYKEFKKHKLEPRLYLVGGAVRDTLLERNTGNFDFVATGLTKKELGNFLRKHGKVVETEKEDFPIFKLIPKGSRLKTPIDVALPRVEKWKKDMGYQDVKIKTSPELGLEDDVGRRDFTINAIAFDYKENKLIDLHNGIEDLRKGVIRAVGKPEDRFNEDPSRILRAIRFSNELDFKIEKNTSEAMREKIGEINKLYDDKGSLKPRVSREIIAKEFLKSFDADPVGTLEAYDKYGILDLKAEREKDKIMPEVKVMQSVSQPKNFHSEGNVWEHTKLTLEKLPPDASIDVKLAALFHDIGKPPTYSKKPGDRIRFNKHDKVGAEITKKICNRLRVSATGEVSVNTDKIVWLVENHMICLSDKVENMKETTIERYFFREDKWGDELLELSKADIEATIPPSGVPDRSNYKLLLKRIDNIRVKAASPEVRKKLKPYLLNGNDIKEITGPLPIWNPLIGDIKESLRELQLSGKIKKRGEAEKLVPKLKEIFEKLFDYSFENLEKLENKDKRIDKALKHITHNM